MSRQGDARGKPGRKSRDDDLRARLETLLEELRATPAPSRIRALADDLQNALDARRAH
ncbi:MAG: hypothetical protein KUL88_09495 [Rhizobium sp.]|nr:hypothetical protein [Rhizobium sp.]